MSTTHPRDEAAASHTPEKGRGFAWARYRPNEDAHRSKMLVIAARKAVSSEPGIVPEVWPLYTRRDRAGIAAEHATLGIWGTHQQGWTAPAHEGRDPNKADHWPRNFGGACRALFNARHGGPDVSSPSDLYGEDNITTRLSVLTRTDETDVAASYLLSLVRLMRSVTGELISFDFDDLFWTLRDWEDPDRRAEKLYRWSSAYFYVPPKTDTGKKKQR